VKRQQTTIKRSTSGGKVVASEGMCNSQDFLGGKGGGAIATQCGSTEFRKTGSSSLGSSIGRSVFKVRLALGRTGWKRTKDAIPVLSELGRANTRGKMTGFNAR